MDTRDQAAVEQKVAKEAKPENGHFYSLLPLLPSVHFFAGFS
jgi:C4-dicarboxylate transporter